MRRTSLLRARQPLRLLRQWAALPPGRRRLLGTAPVMSSRSPAVRAPPASASPPRPSSTRPLSWTSAATTCPGPRWRS
eukprot:13030036-Alexandrium_andersonii.AAC.1